MGVWGVRRACADVFMPVSCVCSPPVRKTELSPIFINLLKDQSRWVRMTAYQALGPFISTFADSNITALLHNDNGEIVITDRELLAQRLEDLEKSNNENTEEKTTTVTVKVNNPEEEVESKTEEENTENRDEKVEEDSKDSPTSSSDSLVKTESDKSDCDENSTEHVISMDIDEDDNDDKEEVKNDQKESKTKPTTKPIVHSKSLDDLSPEEDRAKKYKSSHGSGPNGQTLTSSESFNNFLYWRDPLPVLDDLDDLKKREAEKSSEVNRTVESEDESVKSLETDNS